VGYVRLDADPDVRVAFTNLDAFYAFIETNWSNVLETELWTSDASLVRAICDHPRQALLLSARARDSQAAETLLANLEQTLNLNRAARQPYRYRRSSLEYGVKSWRSDSFAAAIRSLANLLGGQPFLREAYVKTYSGNVETLTPFFDLQSFVQQVGARAGAYGEAAVLMEGREHAIGV